MTKDDGKRGAPVDQFFDPVIIWRGWDDRARMIGEEMERRRKIKAEPVGVAATDAGRPSRLRIWLAAMFAAIVAGLVVAWAVRQFDLP